jgi:hypothetical protein
MAGSGFEIRGRFGERSGRSYPLVMMRSSNGIFSYSGDFDGIKGVWQGVELVVLNKDKERE